MGCSATCRRDFQHQRRASWSNFERHRRVYIRVYMDSGVTNTYDMDITIGENPIRLEPAA